MIILIIILILLNVIFLYQNYITNIELFKLRSIVQVVSEIPEVEEPSLFEMAHEAFSSKKKVDNTIDHADSGWESLDD